MHIERLLSNALRGESLQAPLDPEALRAQAGTRRRRRNVTVAVVTAGCLTGTAFAVISLAGRQREDVQTAAKEFPGETSLDIPAAKEYELWRRNRGATRPVDLMTQNWMVVSVTLPGAPKTDVRLANASLILANGAWPAGPCPNPGSSAPSPTPTTPNGAVGVLSEGVVSLPPAGCVSQLDHTTDAANAAARTVNQALIVLNTPARTVHYQREGDRLILDKGDTRLNLIAPPQPDSAASPEEVLSAYIAATRDGRCDLASTLIAGGHPPVMCQIRPNQVGLRSGSQAASGTVLVTMKGGGADVYTGGSGLPWFIHLAQQTDGSWKITGEGSGP